MQRCLRLADPEYREVYEAARERIGQIDSVIRVMDARREELDLAKAELARRAGDSDVHTCPVELVD